MPAIKYKEVKDEYGPPSDPIKTKETRTTKFKSNSKKVEHDSVEEGRFHPKEYNCLNIEEMTNNVETGSMKTNLKGKERTIMLFGDEKKIATHGRTFAGQKRIPERPGRINETFDTTVISRSKPKTVETDDFDQISYKMVDNKKSTRKVLTQGFKKKDKSITSVTFNEEEGQYSPTWDPIKTKEIKIESYPKKLIHDSVLEVRPLPITQNCINNDAMTKSLKSVGSVNNNLKGKQRTIILFGDTCNEKNTLLNGMVNYVRRVNFYDPMRYTLIHTEDEGNKKKGNQVFSHSGWVTCYTIYPEEGSRIDFTLNIIITPGYGDTRGHKRKEQLVKQIHELCFSRDTNDVLGIDAICFLIQTPYERLTPTQNHIFQSVMSLFGKDVEDNICSLITFADSRDPPVLSSLKLSGLPFGKYFTFHDSALYITKRNLHQSGRSQMHWDENIKSFRAFFDHLNTMHTKSLEQTKAVLETRQNLKFTIKSLLLNVNRGLYNLDSLRRYIVNIKQRQLDNDQSMSFESEIKSKRSKYEEATGKKLYFDLVIDSIRKHPEEIEKDFDFKMETIKACNNKLKEIAILPHPLNLVEQVDVLIETEKSQKQTGFLDRVKELKWYKKVAQYSVVVKQYFDEKKS